MPELTPPVAARKPVERKHHGDVFVDEYEWLRDKTDDEVLDYLRAENEYTKARTAGQESLREAIFGEISERTQQTDLTVPVRRGRYWYYTRTVEGLQYGIHCRVEATSDEPPSTDSAPDGEQVLLDGNAEAGESEFFALGTFDPSPDGRLLAYSVDLTGDERFTLRVKDLGTGELLGDEIPLVHYGSAWSADASTIFYLTVDDAWRPHRVHRHRLGAPVADDVLVLEEPDERYWVDVSLTRNKRAVQIHLASKLTSEVYLIDAAAPQTDPVVVAPRSEGVEYDVEHAGDRLLIVHNANAVNFELAEAPLDAPGHENWSTLIAGDDDSRLLGVDAFAGHVVLFRRRDAMSELAVMRRTSDGLAEPEVIRFEEPIYTVSPGDNAEWDTTSYRLNYTSLVTPSTVYDYDVTTRELTLRKQQPVLGGVDLSAYTQYREWATAPDGTRVPISLVARKDVPVDSGDAPLVLYGYGSYEHSIDPWFSIPRLSLLERGVVFAIAHIRGGGELGRRWYDDGKMLRKKNTFSDFVASAEHVVAAGWTRPDRIVAWGGSAGGLLMGAVANLAPQAFGGIVAQVPFVDALTSILDPSLPLTVTEWEEWGDPLHDPEVYVYMKSYSPYENVTEQAYPPILAITSLNDTRVLYVEPAKWVAKLRSIGASDVLLKTEMEAGHGGRSGRYDAWRELALLLAWMLTTLEVGDK
jgi:oligopeptidase B